MLNSKLVPKSLSIVGFLFFSILVASAGTQRPQDSTGHATKDSIQWVTFDPESLLVSGLPESAVMNAPTIRLNRQAAKFVDDYILRNEETLLKIKRKSVNPFATMDAVFNRYNLPVELKYLAVVESELKTTALSKVGARGLWQLMPTTARDYKLKVAGKYDERTHVYKSTVAAAKYLNYLHDLFGDWLLVIAAYNGGPGSVYKAIRKSGSRNFWKLQYFLPAETRSHVKKFIGTHYFFEGEGSITTLTKEEADTYSRKMMAFVAEQNMLLGERVVKTEEQPASSAIPTESSAIAKSITPGEMRVDEEE